MSPQATYLRYRPTHGTPPVSSSRFLRLVDRWWDSASGRSVREKVESVLPRDMPRGYGDGVEEWLIEFVDGSAAREVGLDTRGEPLCARGYPDYGVFAGEVEIEGFTDVERLETIPADTFEDAWVGLAPRAEANDQRGPGTPLNS